MTVFRKTKRITVSALVLVTFMLIPFFSYGQGFTNQQFNFDSFPNLPGLADYLKIKTFPANPGPNQSVTVSLELYLTNLDKAEISWFLNGEPEKSGVGEKTFQFQTGPIGSTSRVSVLIDTFEGEVAEKEIIIRPASVEILWNANTYTPPFYQGRSLPINQSGITITALPDIIGSNGNRIGSQGLMFRWHRGGTFLSGSSGLGKDRITLAGNSVLRRPLDIKVEVRTLDDSVVAEKSITVPMETPEVLIYENHPLYGLLFNKVVSDFSLTGREVTFSASPYFFGATARNSDNLEYSWSQNNRPVSADNQPSSITLRQLEESQTGTVNVGISVRDINSNFSRARNGARIIIGN